MCENLIDRQTALLEEKYNLLKRIITSEDSLEIDMLTKKVNAIDLLAAQQTTIQPSDYVQRVEAEIKNNVAKYVEQTRHCGWFTCVPGCGHD